MSWKNDPGRRVLQQAQRKQTMSGGKKGAAPKKPSSSGGAAPNRWRLAGMGFVLGASSWLFATLLGFDTLPIPGDFHQLTATGVLGAGIAQTRFRPVLWWVVGALILLVMVIGYTPLIKKPVQSLVRSDVLRPADAAVVLSSNIRKTGEMDSPFQTRVLHGYEVVRQGYAPVLVVTRLPGPAAKRSYVPAIRKQLDQLGIDFPIEEVGPIHNTYEEALAVARLAKKKGWKRIILVTDPTHLRRAGATFTKTGLEVIHSPSRNPDYDLVFVEGPGERLRAFEDWFHEVIGYETYRLQGRL